LSVDVARAARRQNWRRFAITAAEIVGRADVVRSESAATPLARRLL